MKILKNAVAGTLESSDLFIQIEPDDKELTALDCVIRARMETALKRGGVLES